MTRRSPGAVICGVAVALVAAACGSSEPGDRLHVVAAASLRQVVEELADELVAGGAVAAVRVQTGPSVALARRVLELDLRPDVLMLADPLLFDELLIPEWTDAYEDFAGDALVLAHATGARALEEVRAGAWAEVVARPDVRVAMADPDLAPVGQRTVLAMRLHELEHPGTDLEGALRRDDRARDRRPDVASLIAPLQAGAVDYAFLYRSTAMAAGIGFIALPVQIDLSDEERRAAYARVAIEVAGRVAGDARTVRGAPIRFAAAAARDASPAARRFLALLASPRGRVVLERRGFGQ